MPVTITFNNLSNGQSILLPFMVNGRITATVPPANLALVTASKQIDSGSLQSLNCVPAIPGAGNVTQTDFSCELTASNCQPPSGWHMLTIYVWDNANPNATIASVTFRVISSPSGGP